MKKLFILGIVLLNHLFASAQEPEYDHVFFDNNLMTGAYYNSKANSKSPSYIQTIGEKLPTCEQEFFTAKNSLYLNYVSAPTGSWSAALISPDWRGKDFIKESKTLDFRMFIKSETQLSELPKIAIATKDASNLSGYLNLEKYIKNTNGNKWSHVSIPLSEFRNITYTHSKEIAQVLFAQASDDGKEHTIYIDQVELLPANLSQSTTSTPSIQAEAYERHVDLTWDKTGLENVKYIKIYRATNHLAFESVGIQDPSRGRYADYTGEAGKTYQYKITCLDYNYNETSASPTISTTTRHMSDEELLTMVQQASFRYYWDGAEQHSGLALENIPGRKNMIATGASGFGMMALITGTERGFITRDQAVERFKKIVTFLERTETFHGGYAHFVDGITGKVEPFFGMKDNGADMVETSFLFQGLLAARQYFDKNTNDEKYIRNTITKLWKKIEWDWFKKTKKQ